MIINLFRNLQPVTFILIPIFMIVVWISAWQGGSDVVVKNPMPLYNLVINLISASPAWVAGLLGLLLTTSQVFHLNYIIKKHEVLYKNSYLPALFYMLFIAMIPQFLSFHPVMFANTILIFVLDKLFRIYKDPSPLQMVFDICFLVSIATLFYLPAVAFFLLLAVSILILKTFSWRDWLVGLLGAMLPFFFAALYFFWTDDLDVLKEKFFLKNILQLWDTGGLVLQGYRITIAVVAVILALTLIKIRQNFYKNATRIRNFQQVIFILLIVALGSLAFSGSVAVYRFSILTIPLATMISYYFLAARKAWVTETLFWLLFLTLCFNHVNALM